MVLRPFLFASVVLLTACGDAAPPPAKDEPGPAVPATAPPDFTLAVPARVYSVDSITFKIRESMPVQLEIKARGTVRSGGWSKAELRPLIPHAPPAGVRMFTFVATPPRSDEMVTQALSPVEASFTIPALPADVKEIRIVAETNELTQKLP